ncbi:unnamed protein product [Psylliodes chrysocephalus]|uniref:GHMP kinase N-terminal domain-containing protein n=1 Tax=Psylliodes chrysocephalus TaxID=3402493 RepID=A0A9P0GEW4_9CUCU|nr:unnamed protein product [Psylliodes chrysocephala]
MECLFCGQTLQENDKLVTQNSTLKRIKTIICAAEKRKDTCAQNILHQKEDILGGRLKYNFIKLADKNLLVHKILDMFLKAMKPKTLHRLGQDILKTDLIFSKCAYRIAIGEGAPQWYQYFLCGVKGILEILPKDITIKGMRIVVSGNVPQSAGLSSSSALVSAAALATAHANEIAYYIGKYGDPTDRKMMHVEMGQPNEIIDKNTTSETNSKKGVSSKVFTELQPFCEGNATDRKMIPVEMRQFNDIIDEYATNEPNCEKQVSSKVFTELQPLREEYLEDSSVDDSDVDPDYEPSDEKQKNTIKLKFLSRKRKISKGMITELRRHQNKSKGLQIAKDGKGKGTPSNKKDSLIFKDHINSFNPQVSHYKLVHAPSRRYLPSDISITDM